MTNERKTTKWLPAWIVAGIVTGCAGQAPAAPAGATPAAAESGTPDVSKYCASIATAAADARVAWQTNTLNELELRIKARIQELDARQADLRSWMDKRALLAKEANEKLVGIYAKMKPETAASQISALDDDMAATVLAQLSPGKASAIFNELASDKAAKLAGLMAAGPDADKAGEKIPATDKTRATEKTSANDKAPTSDKKL